MKCHLKCVLLFYGLTPLLHSCTKDVHISRPKQKPLLVVNCLFNPDSTWKVFVGKSRSINDTSNASIVKNAHISLSGGGRSIHLTYLDSGYYVSDLKPRAGVEYSIKVSAPGFHAVEASDSIPAKLSIDSYTFDTIPVIITELDILDQVKVNKLVLSIDGLRPNSYAQVKIPAYNKADLYYYTITDSTLSRSLAALEHTGNYLPSIDIPAIISKLSVLKNEPVLSETGLLKRMKEATGISRISFVYDTVLKHAEREPAARHIEALFVPNDIYAQQQPFYNIYGENYYTAFAAGTGSPAGNSFLFYSWYGIFNPEYAYWDDPLNNGEKRSLELWAELTSLSPAAYRFKTTYTKQQMNRGNLFREPVQVYSNIKGGYGIFAGYRLQRIRIY